MIRSMTGFGRASFRIGEVGFDIETRSVNHRHLDVRIRLPRVLASLEPALKECVQAKLSRGKVDLVVSMPDGAVPLVTVEVDREAALAYARAAAALAETDGIEGSLQVGTLLSLPGVARLAERELPQGELEDGMRAAAIEALEALDAMRVSEGGALERDLSARLAIVDEIARSLEARAGVVQQAVRERFRRRAQQLEQETGFLDEGRLHQEIVIAADRLDIVEEIVRLRSHVEQFGEIVASGAPGQPVGRRLDFLLQEFGREANTIGSKGSDSPIAHQVVDLKTEIERMREQVQNIE